MAFVGGLVLAALLVLLAIAVVGFLLRRRILGWASEQLIAASAPAIVNSLPPRVVLSTLLRKIYGNDDSHQSVLVGILGGAGRDVRGRDIATSRRTVVDIRLRSIDQDTYSAAITWTHRLSGVLDSYNFVVFATCDPELWNLIPSERRLPLYESWFVPDEDLLEGFVPNMRESLEVGISYRDDDGVIHMVEPRPLESSEPHVHQYGEFVHLPDGINVENLRILQFDLGQLVDPDHVVGAIETLSVRAAALEPTAEGFFTWSPPYPCYVERVEFDVADLHIDGDEHLLFKVVPFTMTQPGPTLANTWGKAEDVRELALESWLLPGHGVALLWRPADRVDLESRHGP